MISVTCPKCLKSYSVGDDKAGRIFRCQECQGKITVPAPAQQNDPFAPEGEFGIPEALPYEAAEIPEAVPIGKSRRPQTRKKSGGGSTGILIGIGAGVAMFAIAAVVILVILDRQNGPNQPDIAADLRRAESASEFLPHGAPMMIAMQGQAVWRDPLFKQLFGVDHTNNAFAGMTIDHFGFHPDEFIKISIAIQPDDDLSAEGTRWIAAIDLREPINWGSRSQSQFSRRTDVDQSVYDLAGVFDRDYAVWQPQDNVLVFGDVALVDEAIARGPQQPTPTLLELVDDNALVSIAADLQTCDWLQNIFESWGINPLGSLNCRYMVFSPSFMWNSSNNRYDFHCDVDLQTTNARSERILRPVVERALNSLQWENATVEFHLEQICPRVSVTMTPIVPPAVVDFVTTQIEMVKRSAYQVAGWNPPNPITGAGPIDTGRPERNPGRNPVRIPSPQTPPPAVVVNIVRPPALALDLEQVQSTVDAGDLAAFIEMFYPPGVLEDESQRQAEIDRLEDLSANGDVDALISGLIRATPTFSSDGREATFRVALDNAVGASMASANLPGFGSDLETALRSSLDALNAEEFETFMLNMFPASEVTRLQSNPDALAHLQTRLTVFPSMVEAMTSELQECLDVGIETGDAIAEVMLTENRRNARVVRFQLVDGNWRFFDPGAVPEADADVEFETVTLIHDGQSWRLKALPECLER